MSAAHFSDEPNPGMGEPETKELWRRYVFESPPPPPPLPSYRDFKCLEPDDAEDLHDARCDYHSALVVVDTPALSALDGAVKRRLRANRRALAGARRSIALDGVAESGKSTAVKQIGRSVELKLRARHPDWFGGAARTSRQSPT